MLAHGLRTTPVAPARGREARVGRRPCAVCGAAGESSPAARREFLAALPALLLPLPAHARGLDQYIRKPKPAPAVETLVATALLAQEQLQQLGKALADTQNTDVKEFRSFLRFGPLREFREVMRSIAKAQDASDGSILKPHVESLFRMLEDFDAGLTAWQKSEGGDAHGDARTRASTELKAATDELSSILASLPSGVVDRAMALL